MHPRQRTPEDGGDSQSAAAVTDPRAPSTAEHMRRFFEQFHLTSREREVFALLVAGRAPKEIAVAIGIAPSTVRFHSVRFYKKCGVRNQREILAMFARVLQAVPDPFAMPPDNPTF